MTAALPPTESKEECARLYLWASAITQCQRLLSLAERALTESTSQTALDKESRHMESVQAFAHAQPDYTPEVQKYSHFARHAVLYPSEFGTMTDCWAIAEACRMQAIVFFCQIMKSGYADVGRVAGNTRVRDTHFHTAAQRAFGSSEAFGRFKALCDQLAFARDKMIAHAEASAFKVTHSSSVTSMRLHVTALEGIDFAYFASVLEPFRVAICEHAAEIESI